MTKVENIYFENRRGIVEWPFELFFNIIPNGFSSHEKAI